MASDSEERMASALDKLREFEELGYPAAVRRAACLVVARENRGVELLAARAAHVVYRNLLGGWQVQWLEPVNSLLTGTQD